MLCLSISWKKEWEMQIYIVCSQMKDKRMRNANIYFVLSDKCSMTIAKNLICFKMYFVLFIAISQLLWCRDIWDATSYISFEHIFQRYCYQCALYISHGVRMPEIWFPTLTHWGQDEMDAITQTTFQAHFSERKCLNTDYNFTEVCS